MIPSPFSFFNFANSLMFIGIDGLPLGAPKTGIGHYTFELARGLAALAPAVEFELIAPAPPEPPPADHTHDWPANMHAVHAPVNRLVKHWWTIGLPLYARRRPFSLFHGTNYNIPLWNQCPAVVTIHDLSLLLHAETHREELVRSGRRRLPVMIRAARKIITDSASVKREICQHLGVSPEKIAVVPLAPRRAFCPVEPPQIAETRGRLGIEENFLLFVGTVEPRKNLITLVRAFDELLRTTAHRPQLVIAGQQGWLNDDLFRLVESSGVGDRIRFTGYVSDADLCALYSSCRACIYPSLYEGFGLPPLEAMACGAPVVTSRIPVLIETVGAAARLFEPTDVPALARHLAELLADENARRHLSLAGAKRAAGFTWERTARLTWTVYEEVWATEKKKARGVVGVGA